MAFNPIGAVNQHAGQTAKAGEYDMIVSYSHSVE